jgi:hypothetical protein
MNKTQYVVALVDDQNKVLRPRDLSKRRQAP